MEERRDGSVPARRDDHVKAIRVAACLARLEALLEDPEDAFVARPNERALELEDGVRPEDPDFGLWMMRVRIGLLPGMRGLLGIMERAAAREGRPALLWYPNLA